ncbi:MAG TPA: S8 family serine peptidase, partial [Lysobacter sp.]
MTRKARTLKWTALAVATALIAAPAAYSGGRLPVANKVKVSTLSPAAAKAAKEQPQKYDRFIVTYREGARRLSAAAATTQFATAAKNLNVGIAPMRTLATGSSLIHTDRKLDSLATKQLMLELMKDPNVLAVEPDRLRKPLMVPNDPLYAQQWHYKNGPGGINAEPAWDLSTGDGVVVAVLDTGITPHSELNSQTVPGYDFIIDTEVSVDGDGRDADPNDPGDWHDGECNIFGIPEDSSWHGTHVAGTVAAATNNNAGVAGVAFGAKVQPVRVLGKCGGYESDIIDAVTWASGGTVAGVPANATPAEVINLSLGGSGACSVAEQAAYTAAKARGTTVVVSAGNSSADAAGYSPASCNDVITV